MFYVKLNNPSGGLGLDDVMIAILTEIKEKKICSYIYWKKRKLILCIKFIEQVLLLKIQSVIIVIITIIYREMDVVVDRKIDT